MTRQRKWQLEKIAAGLCEQCGREPIAPGSTTRCVACRQKLRDRVREAKRKKEGFGAWRPGGRGRPPLRPEQAGKQPEKAH